MLAAVQKITISEAYPVKENLTFTRLRLIITIDYGSGIYK
jgi:hypothetical protein